jgi:outer membrane receptor protein involved in Fe transport
MRNRHARREQDRATVPREKIFAVRVTESDAGGDALSNLPVSTPADPTLRPLARRQFTPVNLERRRAVAADPMHLPRPVYYSCLLTVLVAGNTPLARAATPAAAAASAARESHEPSAFAIPAGDASTSLDAFSRQSGAALVFVVEQVRGIRTPELQGRYRPREALERLVAKTALTVAEDARTGALMIKRTPPLPSPPAQKPTSQSNQPVKPKSKLALFAGLLAASTGVDAQTPSSPPNNEAVVLSPFEVATSKDYGYTATNSLAGGRLSTELMKTPASISVMTREFLDDLGVSDVQGALRWAANSVAAGNADVSPDATISNSLNGQPSMSGNGNSVSIRGFSSTIARNYFPWFVNSDGYNTERIDISRGPNAMLFGDGAAGGVVNVSTKRARPGLRSSSLQFRLTDEGGKRVSFDVNQPLGKIAAVRVNAVRERSKDWRDYYKLNRDGVHGAVTLNLGPTAQIRAESEWGLVDRRSPSLYLRDRTSNWNGTYTLAAPLTGTQAPAASTGAVRVDTGGNANLPFNVMDLSRPELGFLNWQGSVRTDGLASSLETRLPGHVSSTGLFTGVPVDAPATLGRREFRVVPDYGYAVNSSSFRGKNQYRAHSLFFEKRFGDRFFFEAAGTVQDQDADLYTPASHNSVYIDLNEFLPAGVAINGSTRNPNFLRPYNESSSSFDLRGIINNTTVTEGRLSAIYLLKTRLTHQRVGAVYTLRNQTLFNIGANDFRRTNGTGTPSTRANSLFFRTYLPDGRNASQENLEMGRGGYNFPGGIQADFVGTAQLSKIHSESIQAFANGSWFKNDLLTTLFAARRDTVHSVRYTGGTGLVPIMSWSDVTNGVRANDTKGTVNSPSVGAVLSPVRWLSLYASASKTFVATPGGLAFSFQGNPLPLARGEGRDIGLKFKTWDGRISGSIAYYKSDQTNSSSSRQDIGTAINNIRTFMGLQTGQTFNIFNDTQDSTGKGYELDVTANITPGWSVSANYSLPESVLSNSLPRFRAYLAGAENRPAWETYANNPANSAAADVRRNLSDIDLVLARNADGLPRVNQSDYIANLFTRYRMTSGRLKGFAFGGGVNMLGQRLMALRTGFAPDYSGSYRTFSALLSYDRKWKKLTGNFQLNVTNLFNDENFRYTSLLATGTPQLFRISDPRTLTFTATFKL